MPILGTLIIIVHIYAGTLKTPETGKYKANKAYTAEPCIKVCSSDHWQLYSRKRRKQADRTTCRTLDTMPETETADQKQIPTADSRKCINHSGIIGNAIPGSEKSAETVRSCQADDIEPESS